MDTAELLKKVRRIEIKTKGLSAHLFSGAYHSAFKGRGMSFSEVRSYQYGDDVRNIDWNVTARTGEPHVKVFEEERELTVMLLIDVSASSFFGTATRFKNEYITELCAVLAFSAIHNNDKVGVIFFSDTVEKLIPPQKGRSHILYIIRELINFEPRGKATRLDEALQYLNRVIKKRSICFVLSDFMDRGYDTSLAVAARRHDLIGIHVADPAESALPDIGLARIEDPETGRVRWLDTTSAVLQQRYRAWFAANLEATAGLFRKNGADLFSLRTNESYVQALHQFFRKRTHQLTPHG